MTVDAFIILFILILILQIHEVDIDIYFVSDLNWTPYILPCGGAYYL